MAKCPFNLQSSHLHPKRSLPYAPGLTQQHQKDISDINFIMGKYHQTGMYVGTINSREPQYGDFSALSQSDYRQHLEVILNAQREFDALPAALRRHYDDNVENFLDAVARGYAGSVDKQLVDFGIFPDPEGVGTVTPLDVTVPTDTKKPSDG